MGIVHSTSRRPLFKRSDKAHSNGRNILPNSISHHHHHHPPSPLDVGVIDSPVKIFNVINVDDRGNEINHGQIEITDNDLILHQRNKNSIVWPLRSLRRYGFDAELFSFECGRRCTTGPGIYAFKCLHAEQLFNVLQESLQHCTNITTPNANITSPRHALNQETNGTVPVTTSGAPVSSPSPTTPELVARTSVPSSHSYVNDIRSYINSPFYANTNYAKLDDLVDYANIDTATAQFQIGSSSSTTSRHPQPEPLINPKSPTKTELVISESFDTNEPIESVNYIVLDLENSNTNNNVTYVTTAPVTPIFKTPEEGAFILPVTTPPSTPTSLKSISSNYPPQSYATIDFDKTLALSNSAANHRTF